MHFDLDPTSIDDYRLFLKIKALPSYKINGRRAFVPDEYASRIGVEVKQRVSKKFTPSPFMFDYQRDIACTSVSKQKYALFIECGLGKTLIFLDYARHVLTECSDRKCILIVSPSMVIEQTLAECRKFYGDSLEIEQVHADGLQEWLRNGKGRIGITNYEAIREGLDRGRLGCLILDEGSSLKSHYGKWGTRLIEMGKGLDWKLVCTGTPAPNDRIEYANHAVFLDQFPTVNAFLARYFVNKGNTSERWELKKHAVKAFYRSMSHWCIFLTNPATYGWKDNASNIPPIHVHIHHVSLTDEQEQLSFKKQGFLFASEMGGIASRATMGGIAKGHYKGKRIETLKPKFIRRLVDSWPTESTIIWCLFNKEQELLEQTFPEAASIKGDTPYEERMRVLRKFKAGEIKTMISKAKVLGFGLNLQIVTRQVFSGLADSYEGYYQAVKRSNRVGSTRPLNVHIPITDIEAPMVDNVLRKARMVQSDSEAQEQVFKENMARVTYLTETCGVSITEIA